MSNDFVQLLYRYNDMNNMKIKFLILLPRQTT